MAMKMKGIYKGFKCISQIFVVKEREMEIGYPTDVKHVAHIGWEGSSGSAPSWMSEFKAGAELLSPRHSSFGNARHSNSFFSAGSSNDFDQTSKQPIMSSMSRATPSINLPSVPSAMKKSRKKKSASSGSSPRSISSSRSSRSFMSKSTYKSAASR